MASNKPINTRKAMYIDFDKALGDTLERYWDLPLYEKIMRQVGIVNVSSDEDLQKTYNYFYQVRRNEAWRRSYYDLFEQMKHTKNVSFSVIITELFRTTGNIEASFSSKMLSTLNPSKPIWDSIVCKNLGLKPTGKTKEEELKNVIVLYEKLGGWYKEYLKTENAQDCITRFDALLPKYVWLSDTKKIDYLIWSIRE